MDGTAGEGTPDGGRTPGGHGTAGRRRGGRTGRTRPRTAPRGGTVVAAGRTATVRQHCGNGRARRMGDVRRAGTGRRDVAAGPHGEDKTADGAAEWHGGGDGTDSHGETALREREGTPDGGRTPGGHGTAGRRRGGRTGRTRPRTAPRSGTVVATGRTATVKQHCGNGRARRMGDVRRAGTGRRDVAAGPHGEDKTADGAAEWHGGGGGTGRHGETALREREGGAGAPAGTATAARRWRHGGGGTGWQRHGGWRPTPGEHGGGGGAGMARRGQPDDAAGTGRTGPWWRLRGRRQRGHGSGGTAVTGPGWRRRHGGWGRTPGRGGVGGRQGRHGGVVG
ncbi:hypothetical protein FB475_6719 [Kribbella jejuensis]|uniref:Uncharacterized protein n=1 Tax=Kribbella jejuensis TaxID=236068 RepID=A0A542D9I2_9ACTN|nr:hypothetical protein FB475_6719 [Kribbella jejuensis]